jgi:hypothetical protein
LGIIFSLSITICNRFNKVFSNAFEIIGSKDIGRYEVVSCGGLPGFEIIITYATFHILGTYLDK